MLSERNEIFISMRDTRNTAFGQHGVTVGNIDAVEYPEELCAAGEINPYATSG